MVQMFFLFLGMVAVLPVSAGEVVLTATSDIWLSNANEEERKTVISKLRVFKLKSIQEMAVVRFDASKALGIQIESARLYLHPAKHPERLKYLRLSTVNQDWEKKGATYNSADRDGQKSWAWPGSQFCDVAFGNGNTLSFWEKIRLEKNGWVSVPFHPDLIYSLTTGNTDGIALQEGGTNALFNNFIHSSNSSRYAPYVRITTGNMIKKIPDTPEISTAPDLLNSTTYYWAVELTLQGSDTVFFWNIFIDGASVPRWKIKKPFPGGKVRFLIDGIKPGKAHILSITAISRSGHRSDEKKIPIKSFNVDSPYFLFDHDLDETVVTSSEGIQNNLGLRFNVLPGISKTDPQQSLPTGLGNKNISLFGICGEFLDRQLIFEDSNPDLRISLDGLSDSVEMELYQVWYSKTKQGRWQSAYLLPESASGQMDMEQTLRIPNKKTQGVYLDFFIKSDAKPGVKHGYLHIKNKKNQEEIKLPVQVHIFNAAMPETLSFWPEMNAYQIPKNVHDYYRLARKNRCVANFWVFSPVLKYKGNKILVDWSRYDKEAGPLLSGKVFTNGPGKGRPIECMYLPFIDSWPTPLTKQTYDYQGYWPKKGDDMKYITQHYMTSAYIGDALSSEYKENFKVVQQQFFQHFEKMGWNGTEMQCFFGGKNTHRIDYNLKVAVIF